MGRTLAVCVPKHREAMASLLSSCGCGPVLFAQSAGEARRRLLEGEFQLVVINAPLPDEFGRDLALSVVDSAPAGVILFVAAAQAKEVAAGVEKLGVFVLEKPVSRILFSQAARLAGASWGRLFRLHQENRRLLGQLEDIRLICRAKCALCRRFSMTEDEAHHYIEHRAMDLRVSRREAALEVLASCGEAADR